jgi:hypothetical protein
MKNPQDTRSILSRLFDTVVGDAVFGPGVGVATQVSAPYCRDSLRPWANNRRMVAGSAC